MTSSSCRDKIEYIYQLPFLTRSELCKILNQNDKWEELAANPLPVTLSCVPTNKKKDDNVLKPEATIPCVIYNELNIATNEWNKNNILGRGGFGTVYREDRLRMRRKSQPLSWIQRHEIAKGTACGLQYLHTIGEKPLIHGDIKSANILLDKNFEPRIGDFGLAREGLENDSMKVSKIHGTRPYLPEEFLHERKLSTKVDTYSYGIVLFELATGLPVYDESRLENKFLKDLIGTLENENLVSLIDKKAGEKNKQVFDNFMILGKWCSNHQAENRPEMYNVFKKLNDL